jgi:hypothetical protein
VRSRKGCLDFYGRRVTCDDIVSLRHFHPKKTGSVIFLFFVLQIIILLGEYFPSYPVTRSEMEGCLDEGCEDILDDLPEDMPPKIILECYCTIFGHMCPVFLPGNHLLKLTSVDDYLVIFLAILC